MIRLARYALFLAFPAIAACATPWGSPCGDPGPYLDSRPGQVLEIPEGLERPPADRLARIPEGADTVHPELRGPYVDWPDGTTTCLTEPPPMREITL